MANIFEKLSELGANTDLLFSPIIGGVVLGGIAWILAPPAIGIPLAIVLVGGGVFIGIKLVGSAKDSGMSASTFLAYQHHNAEADQIGKMRDENGHWVPNPNYIAKGWHDDNGQWVDNPAYLEKMRREEGLK